MQDEKGPDTDTHTDLGLNAEPDHELVARIAKGDHAAFAVMVNRHTNQYLALAHRVLGRRDEAEDAVQEAFVKFWKNAHRYERGKALFTTWFYRIVVNQCLDKKRQRRLLSLPEHYDAVDEGPGPDEALREKQLAEYINSVLKQLPERQRLAIILCYYDGLTNKDAANILDVNIKALESLLTRGRRGLETSLGEMGKTLLDMMDQS